MDVNDDARMLATEYPLSDLSVFLLDALGRAELERGDALPMSFRLGVAAALTAVIQACNDVVRRGKEGANGYWLVSAKMIPTTIAAVAVLLEDALDAYQEDESRSGLPPGEALPPEGPPPQD